MLRGGGGGGGGFGEGYDVIRGNEAPNRSRSRERNLFVTTRGLAFFIAACQLTNIPAGKHTYRSRSFQEE